MFQLVCTSCDRRIDDGDVNACPDCGGILRVRYLSTDVSVFPDQAGIWKYSDLLPLHDVSFAVSLGEGNTPLLRSASIGPAHDLPALYFKMESANPTGSYKDRIAAVGTSRLRELDKDAWAATSSGNAGAAIAAYGVRAGLDGYLFTLEKASKAKIAQILTYGPTVFAVDRLGYDPDVEQQTWANIGQICDANNWGMLVTAHRFSPHGMEGAKTIAYEVCEQLQNRAPDVVYVPVGGGGLLSATWKGFFEWKDAGYIDRLPRIVAVQACGCDAVTQAWEAGRGTVPTIPDCTSTISGLQLTAPPDGDLVLEALAESDGWAISIPDEETYQMQAELAAQEGVFVEPASAITVAAVKADLERGRLNGDEQVVCWLTGVGFKDADAVQRIAEQRPVRRISAGDILDLNK